jgi:hypothetical protein
MERKAVPQIQVRSYLRSGATGGGNVNGVWYPDMSGVCGGGLPPVPPYPPYPPAPNPNPGGGYVNGVWYSDQSGVCA